MDTCDITVRTYYTVIFSVKWSFVVQTGFTTPVTYVI